MDEFTNDTPNDPASTENHNADPKNGSVRFHSEGPFGGLTASEAGKRSGEVRRARRDLEMSGEMNDPYMRALHRLDRIVERGRDTILRSLADTVTSENATVRQRLQAARLWRDLMATENPRR